MISLRPFVCNGVIIETRISLQCALAICMFSFQFERRKVYARGGLTPLTWRNSGPLLPWMTTPFSFMYRIYTKYYARGFCFVVFCSGELSTDFTNILHGTSLPLGQWYYDDILAPCLSKKIILIMKTTLREITLQSYAPLVLHPNSPAHCYHWFYSTLWFYDPWVWWRIGATDWNTGGTSVLRPNCQTVRWSCTFI